jgi:lactate dehydrogenase-like 2-hydroxyacid dehydrogenase
MMMIDFLRVLVLSPLPDEALDELRNHFAPCYRAIGSTLSPTELASAARGFDVLLITIDVRLTRAHIDCLPEEVRAIATYSVGHDHIDVRAARDRHLLVLNTPAVLTDSVAEVALLLMLGAARRATESISLIRSGQWPGWTARQLNGIELCGKAAGILGLGRIGRAIAARARAFGMTIHYSNRTRLDAADELGAQFHGNPDDMLPCIDVLILAAPSTEGTRGFLNLDRVRRLKRGCIVVNVARGDLIADEALIGGLISGQVGAAGLDVFNNEPRFDRRYATLPNVFMLPHIGSSTIEARRRMAAVLVDGLERWIANREVPNRIA